MKNQPDITGLFADSTMEKPRMNVLLIPTLIDGELGIRDVDLGERLGVRPACRYPQTDRAALGKS
jgi:hypothetical protein